MTKAIRFETRVPDVGMLALRPVQLPEDLGMIHDWVGRPYARFWNMGDKTKAEIAAFYAEMDASAHEAAYVGLFEAKPAFLVETYDPAHHELARHYEVRRGDRGMHVLVGPTTTPVPGFTRAVFRTIMDFLFQDRDVRRVVVEPDVRNAKIQPPNAMFGFIKDRDVALKGKVAALSFCTRERYETTVNAEEPA